MIIKGSAYVTKVAKIKEAGAKRLHIISDFDKTLTIQDSPKYGKHKSTVALIRDGEYLTPDYPQRARDLFAKYHPFEVDHTLSKEVRDQKMLEWWETHRDIMVECGMSREVIEDIVAKENIDFREGFAEFVNILNQSAIPLLIFSAGIGDIIEGKLKKHDWLTDNIHILSNTYTFNEEGKATGYEGPIIHVFNKNEGQVHKHGYTDAVTTRSNVILLGDSLGDPTMAEGMQHDTVLKIGFYNKDTDDALPAYQEAYDMVIKGDGPMTAVVELLKEIVD